MRLSSIITTVFLILGVLCFERSTLAQGVEQELANYGNLPDSTLRAESCVRAGDFWFCSLHTSYYFFNPQANARLVKLDGELQVVASIDQPDRQWNYLFEASEQSLHAFGVEYHSPLKSAIIGAEVEANLSAVSANQLSDSLESAILYDVVKHAGGYTLLYGHVVPVNQFPFHKLGLIEVSNDLEIIRQQEFDQFPDLYLWVPAPNHYRLCLTNSGDYAVVGNNVTWLAQEDWTVIGESETQFLYNEIGGNMGFYLGSVIPSEDAQQVLVSLTGFGDETAPGDFEPLNDVYVVKVDIGDAQEELYTFGRVDTNDAPPLKGFIEVEDGYLVAAQSWKYWYIWQDDENTGVDWPTSTLLTKLNSEMEPEWELALIDEQQTTVRGVVQDPEAGILLYGQRKYIETEEYYAHFVLLPNNPVGLDEEDPTEVFLYPNPTTSHVHLQLSPSFSSRTDVTIYNTTGRVVARHNNFNASEPLQLPKSPGMYFIECRNGERVARTRVVVK